MTDNKIWQQTAVGLLISMMVIGAAVYWFMRIADEVQAGSTVSSIYYVIKSSNWGEPAPDAWREIGESEYADFVRHHYLQIDSGPRSWLEGDVLVDPWGGTFGIALREGRNGQADYVVWSNGRDGVMGTADDIYIHAKSSGVTTGAVNMP